MMLGLTASERVELETLRASRPDDEPVGIMWMNGRPHEVVWASDCVEVSRNDLPPQQKS